jgi:2-C-methyl-D-erythritol 4-phosphate cytidylyltransferase
LCQAFQKAYSDNYYGTDEACIAERFGVRVKIVVGNYENIKITTPEDLEIAQLIVKKRFSG